jgi:hypothetical protein
VEKYRDRNYYFIFSRGLPLGNVLITLPTFFSDSSINLELPIGRPKGIVGTGTPWCALFMGEHDPIKFMPRV